ncbi:sporulation protein [Virgibacillus sp. AGTR]|uniref:Sporulation protein n=1 Tax=Virgibacillus salarius TaxID=447199 RepID=A0A941IA26_9BACI|nr:MULTISPECIES: sporulation protein [Virgibacillus]NAZ07692.1 sporulation protein [Agaribacter marinus]MBR7794972.1 sporulation protein [Virgibacillus salarius]MCC2252539.1 sporulation protein [Virgibacillus sp. AGTR]MDY7046092.1 sporulation protein [Virgibacillus sp. M23]QRZ18745.1 sporulation protein [Virgibacillus sp. AGTR]
MFKKLLNSVGIGSAKIDTKLSKTEFVPGEALEGVLEIEGGNNEQEIDAIYLKLMGSYTYEYGEEDKEAESSVLLQKYELGNHFTIEPNESKTIPFHFELPADIPATLGKTKVWIETGLDIKKAIDPSDRDYIKVYPHPLVDAFLRAANSLGFKLKEVTCENAPRQLRKRLPIMQEYEFKAYQGKFRGKLDEIEAIFFVSESDVEVILEIDRKARGVGGFLSEVLEMDESRVGLRYGPDDIDNLSDDLEEIINQHS